MELRRFLIEDRAPLDAQLERIVRRLDVIDRDRDADDDDEMDPDDPWDGA